MTKEKQIEELCEVIASMICEIYNPLCDEYEPHTCSHCYANSTKIGDLAEMLYNAGYHRQGEVAKEIFEEIEKLAFRLLNDKNYVAGDLIYDIGELKLRYMEKSDDDR